VDDGITVTGVGQASAAPDVLRIFLAAEASATTVSAALDGASTALERIRQALLDAGVAVKDLASSNVVLHPQYGDRGGIQGYVARLGLQAALRDLGSAGELLADAVAAGGDAARLDGMAFEVADQTALQTEARAAAWENARAAAGQYAELSGRTLGRVLAAEEGGGAIGPVRAGIALAAAHERSAVPVEPGTSTVTVQVQVRWELTT
jgi:uncharacterized protein YggE